MTTLSELTVQVLTARLAKRDMSLEELQKEMVAISNQLKAIDAGTELEPAAETPVEQPKPQLTIKQAFKKDEVICMICNKGFKTLKKHLTLAHQITDKEYKKQYNIPSKQPLVAKSYSDQKKAYALDNKLGDKMQAGRKASLAVKDNAVPVVEVKAPVPAVKKKAATPVVKTAVTAKMEKKAEKAIAALKKMTMKK